MRTVRKGGPLVQKVRTVQPCDPPKQAKTPGRPGIGPQRSNATWCLRHGQTGHSTATCDISSAPILLPPEELKEQFENVCLWCNLYGHTMIKCMRRAPVLAIENHTAIGELKTKMGALKKAISEVQDAQKDLPEIRRPLEGIENWQSSVDTHITQAAALAREAQSTAAAATPRSRFKAYLRDEFQPALQRILDVEHTAAACQWPRLTIGCRGSKHNRIRSTPSLSQTRLLHNTAHLHTPPRARLRRNNPPPSCHLRPNKRQPPPAPYLL